MDMTKVLSISIHALLTESDWLLGTEFQTLPLISIHALLTESDAPLAHHPRDSQISIHALLTESDVKKKTYRSSVFVFQSTLSLRRATKAGGTGLADLGISIHALLAESDILRTKREGGDGIFQSTLSLRRATFFSRHAHGLSSYFNPRSPCGERLHGDLPGPGRHNFNPRSPCGERHSLANAANNTAKFQSTLSLRRATAAVEAALCRLLISIHALLAESDSIKGELIKGYAQFQSTLSLRRATAGRAI